MQKLKLVLVGLVVVFVLSETPAFAQGMPNMGGGGWEDLPGAN